MSENPVQNAIDKLPDILKKSLDRNLCSCNEVPTMNVIQAIVDGATTVEEVTARCYAGDGIGCCTLQITDFIECLSAPSEPKT